MPNKVMLSAGSRPYISVALAGKPPLDVLRGHAENPVRRRGKPVDLHRKYTFAC